MKPSTDYPIGILKSLLRNLERINNPSFQDEADELKSLIKKKKKLNEQVTRMLASKNDLELERGIDLQDEIIAAEREVLDWYEKKYGKMLEQDRAKLLSL